MPLLENQDRAAATTVFEREIRRIEERDKQAQTIKNTVNDIHDTSQNESSIASSIAYANHINILKSEQAEEKRLKRSKDRINFERNESLDVVNDYENPRERARRYQDMDSFAAKIAAERSQNSLNKNKDMTINNSEGMKYSKEERTVTS